MISEWQLILGVLVIFGGGIWVGYFQARSNIKKEAEIYQSVWLRGLEDYHLEDKRKVQKKTDSKIAYWRNM